MAVPDASQYPGVVPVQQGLPAYWSFDVTGLDLTTADIHLSITDGNGVARRLLQDPQIATDTTNHRVRVRLGSDAHLKRLPLGLHQAQLAIIDYPDGGHAQAGNVLRVYQFPVLLLQ